MKIGIVMPEEILPDISSFIQREFPQLTLLPFPYRSILEIPEALSGRQNQADMFLFLGRTARHFAEKAVPPAVPWHEVPRSASALLRLLFRAAVEGRPMRIATDWNREDMFRLAFHEIGIPPERYAVRIQPVTVYSEERLVRDAARMAALYRAGAVDFCITIFYRVRTLLEEAGVPVYILQPSFEDIRAGIERLILSYELRRSQSSQIAVIALRLSASEEQFPADRGYDLASAFLAASRPVWQFARSIRAACVERPPSGYLLFSTRTLIENATGQYHQIPLLSSVRANTPFTLSMGFGFGASAEEAKLHAERAVQRALRRGGDQAYLIGPGLASPLPLAAGNQLPPEEPDRPMEEKLLPLAQKTGISVRTLSLLARAGRDTGRRRFTSAELADFTGVTPRTMNRILLKLLDSGAAREAGHQFANRTGRPSRLIELLLP